MSNIILSWLKGEKCEECSTRLEIKDREDREVDQFIASLSEK